MSGSEREQKEVRTWTSASWEPLQKNEVGDRESDYIAFEQETDRDNNHANDNRDDDQAHDQEDDQEHDQENRLPQPKNHDWDPNIGRGASAAPSVESEKIGATPPKGQTERTVNALIGRELLAQT
ncbi:MAG: hypothetical protein EXS10_09215 [Phycisphaerales bacterium]|nr:hypothetical protein [Phycisphaerales bacterium]